MRCLETLLEDAEDRETMCRECDLVSVRKVSGASKEKKTVQLTRPEAVSAGAGAGGRLLKKGK